MQHDFYAEATAVRLRRTEVDSRSAPGLSIVDHRGAAG